MLHGLNYGCFHVNVFSGSALLQVRVGTQLAQLIKGARESIDREQLHFTFSTGCSEVVRVLEGAELVELATDVNLELTVSSDIPFQVGSIIDSDGTVLRATEDQLLVVRNGDS